MALYVDDYGAVETSYVIAASLINPYDTSTQTSALWLLVLILDVGDEPISTVFTYPSRVLRDGAFETLCHVLKRETLNEHV